MTLPAWFYSLKAFFLGPYMALKIIILVLVLLVAGAGIAYLIWKKIKSRQFMPPLPTKLRTDLLYGYYGRDDEQCQTTQGSVNMVIEMRWDEVSNTVARMKKQPLKTILCLTAECFINRTTPRPVQTMQTMIRQTLDTLKAEGVLNQIIGFYPADEPNIGGLTDANMNLVNQTIRGVIAEYPELNGAILAVIYGSLGNFVGVSTFDWVGMDDYPEGNNVLIENSMKELRGLLRPDQRIILMPGGADPFQNNPEAFRRMAHNDPKVVALVPFLWKNYNANNHDYNGIGANSMKEIYTEVGKGLIG